MPKEFAVLQSGFVSNDDTILTLPPVDDNIYRDYVMNKDYLRDKNIYFYSKDLTELFNEHMESRGTVMNDIDFREKIVRSAYRLFGVDGIEDWLHMQSGQKHISNLHIEFLEATLKFATGNAPRRMHIFQWINLLSAVDPLPKSEQFPFIDYFGRYEMGRQVFTPKVRIPEKLELLLCSWLEQPNGWMDLLGSLYVIFGQRKGIRDVSDRYGH